MLHICSVYRSSLKSSPLHNQPSQLFGVLHVTLQVNDCTSSSFPVTLWPSMKVKIIQIESYCRVKLCLAPHKIWEISSDTGQCYRYISWNNINRDLFLDHDSCEINLSQASNIEIVQACCILSKSTEKFLRKWACKFLISHSAVTLDKGQKSFICVFMCGVKWFLPSCQVWKKSVCECLNASPCYSFQDAAT